MIFSYLPMRLRQGKAAAKKLHRRRLKTCMWSQELLSPTKGAPTAMCVLFKHEAALNSQL